MSLWHICVILTLTLNPVLYKNCMMSECLVLSGVDVAEEARYVFVVLDTSCDDVSSFSKKILDSSREGFRLYSSPNSLCQSNILSHMCPEHVINQPTLPRQVHSSGESVKMTSVTCHICIYDIPNCLLDDGAFINITACPLCLNLHEDVMIDVIYDTLQ